MKKILILVLGMFLMFSCGESNIEKVTEEEKMKTKEKVKVVEEKEIKTNIINVCKINTINKTKDKISDFKFDINGKLSYIGTFNGNGRYLFKEGKDKKKIGLFDEINPTDYSFGKISSERFIKVLKYLKIDNSKGEYKRLKYLNESYNKEHYIIFAGTEENRNTGIIIKDGKEIYKNLIDIRETTISKDGKIYGFIGIVKDVKNKGSIKYVVFKDGKEIGRYDFAKDLLFSEDGLNFSFVIGYDRYSEHKIVLNSVELEKYSKIGHSEFSLDSNKLLFIGYKQDGNYTLKGNLIEYEICNNENK